MIVQMTQLEATNRALGFLGVAPIAAVSDQIYAARVTLKQFRNSHAAVMGEFPWPFGLRFDELIESGTPAAGWAYSFIYPANAFILWDVYRQQGKFTVDWEVHARDIQKIKYIVIEGPTNPLIYTNWKESCAEYSIDIQFVDMPNILQEAVTLRLAADCAVALTGSKQIAQAITEEYNTLILLAKNNVLNDRNIEKVALGTNVRRPGAQGGGEQQ